MKNFKFSFLIIPLFLTFSLIGMEVDADDEQEVHSQIQWDKEFALAAQMEEEEEPAQELITQQEVNIDDSFNHSDILMDILELTQITLHEEDNSERQNKITAYVQKFDAPSKKAQLFKALLEQQSKLDYFNFNFEAKQINILDLNLRFLVTKNILSRLFNMWVTTAEVNLELYKKLSFEILHVKLKLLALSPKTEIISLSPSHDDISFAISLKDFEESLAFVLHAPAHCAEIKSLISSQCMRYFLTIRKPEIIQEIDNFLVILSIRLNETLYSESLEEEEEESKNLCLHILKEGALIPCLDHTSDLLKLIEKYRINVAHKAPVIHQSFQLNADPSINSNVINDCIKETPLHDHFLYMVINIILIKYHGNEGYSFNFLKKYEEALESKNSKRF